MSKCMKSVLAIGIAVAVSAIVMANGTEQMDEVAAVFDGVKKSEMCGGTRKVVYTPACVCESRVESVKAERVRFVTFNIRMGCGHDDPFSLERGSVGYLPKCAEVIRSLDPDYVGLQEVDRDSKRAGFMDQTKVVAELSGLHGEWVEKVPKYGISMLSKRRPLSVKKVLMKGKAHTRALMICDYGDIVVANSHFPLTKKTRLMAAESVRSELNKWIGKKPVFFMGDLNANPDSPEMAILKKDFTVISDEDTPTWPSKNPERVIDYIMVSKAHADRVRVVAKRTVAAPHATDHSAVVVDVEIVSSSGMSGKAR